MTRSYLDRMGPKVRIPGRNSRICQGPKEREHECSDNFKIFSMIEAGGVVSIL